MESASFLKFLIAVSGVFIIRHTINAQVSLSPTALFIRDDTCLGELYISNPSGNDILEVTVYAEFGYPAPGPEGDLMMVSHDTLRAATSCFASRLRIFPRSFLLMPRQQQVVRLQVRPDREKPDQAWFTRIIVRSGLPTPDAGTATIKTEDDARVRYVFKQNIPAFFMKGKVSTGIRIISLEIQPADRGLTIWAEIMPYGNAPFLGSLSVSLQAEDQKKSTIHQQSVAFYVEGSYRFAVPLQMDQLKPGHYEVECLFETRRSDISANDLIQADSVMIRKSMELGLP